MDGPVANSIFTREGFAVEQAFIETNRQSFDATVEALDFSDPDGAAKTMNDWAKKHTNGRIDEIMEPSMITPDLVMTLMNALYFKADWRYAFEEKATKDEPFALRDGSTRNVKMMHQEGTFPHYAGDGFEALELPYGDSLYALTVLLPDAGRDVNALVQSLDAGVWQGVLDIDLDYCPLTEGSDYGTLVMVSSVEGRTASIAIRSSFRSRRICICGASHSASRRSTRTSRARSCSTCSRLACRRCGWGRGSRTPIWVRVAPRVETSGPSCGRRRAAPVPLAARAPRAPARQRTRPPIPRRR